MKYPLKQDVSEISGRVAAHSLSGFITRISFKTWIERGSVKISSNAADSVPKNRE